MSMSKEFNMAILPEDDGTYMDNAGADPWGADRTAAEDGAALAAQAVANGSRIRHLEAALAAEKAKRIQAEKKAGTVNAATGELAIRKFLDDLAGVGLPSTLYSHFSASYREFITMRLVFWAETANRMLGEMAALPTDAIAIRDAQYEEQDAEEDEAGRMFIKSTDGPDDDSDSKDAFTEMMDQAFGTDDGEDDDADPTA